MRFLTIASIAAGAQALSLFKFIDDQVNFWVPSITEDDGKEPIPGDSPVEVCEAGRPQLFNVTSLELDPELPEAGKNLTIQAEAVLLTTVTDGAYVDVVVKYGLITLVNQRYDLCDELGEADVGYTCPVKPGPITINKEVEIPSSMPPGEYIVIAKAYTIDDELLTCLFSDVVLGV